MTRSKTLLFIDQYATLGGGQIALMALIESALDDEWNVSVLAPLGGDLESQLRDRFGERVALRNLFEMKMSSGRKSWRDAVTLTLGSLALFSHLNFIWRHEVVYVNGARWFAALGFMSLFCPARYFFHIHLDHSKYQKRLLGWISHTRFCERLVANSKFVLSRLESENAISRNKIVLLRYGLSKSLSTQPFINRFRTLEQRFRVVTIGRLSKEKAQHTIVDIAPNLANYQFHFIGATDFQDKNYELDLRSRRPANIHFEGKSANIEKKIELLEPAISIVPSEWEEPFGLVAVESMALSLLTLTSGRGGLREICDETGAGTFTTKQDLEHQLQQLAQVPIDTLLARAKREHEAAIAIFGWEPFSKNFQLLLKGAH